MRMLYEQELRKFLEPKPTDAAISEYARQLIESNNARNWQKASELSYLLRRENRHEASVEVARMMYEKDPTVDKLNLYFVSVVDKGDIDQIREMDAEVQKYVGEHGNAYQKHLYATWLKAANRIQDDQMFHAVFDQVPAEEKRENSYIVSQYFVYLNRHSMYAEVMAHYDTLPPNVQNSKFVRRYYENARARMGYTRSGPNETLYYPKGNPFTGTEMEYARSGQDETPYYPVRETMSTAAPSEGADTTDPAESGKKKRVFLVYGNKPQELMLIKMFLQMQGIESVDIAENATGGTILEKFERYASDSRFAIVLLTPADQLYEANAPKEPRYHARQNVILEWGYFLGRLGKDHIAVIVSRGIGNDLVLPSDMLGTDVINVTGTTEWMKKLTRRLEGAGFEIAKGKLPF